MFIVKKGNKYYFGRKNGTPNWGDRKSLAKRYSSEKEIETEFKNLKLIRIIEEK